MKIIILIIFLVGVIAGVIISNPSITNNASNKELESKKNDYEFMDKFQKKLDDDHQKAVEERKTWDGPKKIN